MGWDVCLWALHGIMYVCVENCPLCSTLHYIQGLLCFRAKYQFHFCTHEGTLCVCVCIFVPFWRAHLFSIQKYSVEGFLSEATLNLFISQKESRLPRGCEMEKKYRMVLNSMSYTEKNALQVCWWLFLPCSFSHLICGFKKNKELFS